MQAGIEALLHDLTQAVTTAVVVRASVPACPECYCAPSLACPPLTCSCPGGEGVVAPAEGAGFSAGQLALTAGVGLLVGAALGAAAVLWATRPSASAPTPARAAVAAAAPDAIEDVQALAAAQAKAFRRASPTPP